MEEGGSEPPQPPQQPQPPARSQTRSQSRPLAVVSQTPARNPATAQEVAAELDAVLFNGASVGVLAGRLDALGALSTPGPQNPIALYSLR